MKTLLLKTLSSFAAAVIASASALSLPDTGQQDSLASLQGFRRIAPFVCSPVKVCNNLPGPICIDGVDFIYGKATPSSDCIQILTHRP